MSDITYEPTREHWTPYELWMRDLLADDARVSWVGLDLEYRATWAFLDLDNTGWNLDHKVRIHPDDAPERPAEDDPKEEAMRDCDAEMCPMWDGDGCPCATFDLDRDDFPSDGVFTIEREGGGTDA